MAEKTIVEKAAEGVGYGLAMAEDVAGGIKNSNRNGGLDSRIRPLDWAA